MGKVYSTFYWYRSMCLTWGRFWRFIYVANHQASPQWLYCVYVWRRFVKTNRATERPRCRVNEYNRTAGSRSPARWLPQWPSAARGWATANVDLRWPPFVSYASFRASLKIILHPSGHNTVFACLRPSRS